jgi:nitrite reductase (NO-forming)
MLKVSGEERKDVYSGKEGDSVYISEKASGVAQVAVAAAALQSGTLTLEQQVAAGSVLYQGTCSTCHQPEGQGIPAVFPPLAKSDFLMADERRAIGIVLNGLTGKVTVNGETFDSVMPPMSQLSDDEVAHILTFVMNGWGNGGGVVTPDEVAAVRASTPRPPGAAP